jgi:hypothetical protein
MVDVFNAFFGAHSMNHVDLVQPDRKISGGLEPRNLVREIISLSLQYGVGADSIHRQPLVCTCPQ